MVKLNEYYIGGVYTKNPDDIVFSADYTEFNPTHDENTYEAVKELIVRLGQQKPILMLDGKCIDGRHRTKIAKELGITVKCVDVDPKIDPKELILIANMDSMGSRSYSPAQKAINAYKLARDYGYKQKDAAKLCGTPPKQVTYVKSIVKYGYKDAVEELERGNKVMIGSMDAGSTSLEYICKMAKIKYEEDRVQIDTSERVEFSPEAAIKTEAGKAWYYDKINSLGFDKDMGFNSVIRQDYAELANYKFKEL